MKIVAENLSKRFNREWIFKKLTYTFESGNTYAIVGPNGSGKSTLLQVLWGQLPPSSGSLVFRNETSQIPVDDVFASLSIAAPYQELIEEFTLLEMVKFHFRFKKPRNGMNSDEVVERMDLVRARDKQILNFSSGMRQRLKLGLALFSEVEMIFLDEPTSNLDDRSSEWYRQQLQALPENSLVFIASNQVSEYPATAHKIDILTFK